MQEALLSLPTFQKQANKKLHINTSKRKIYENFVLYTIIVLYFKLVKLPNYNI